MHDAAWCLGCATALMWTESQGIDLSSAFTRSDDFAQLIKQDSGVSSTVQALLHVAVEFMHHTLHICVLVLLDARHTEITFPPCSEHRCRISTATIENVNIPYSSSSNCTALPSTPLRTPPPSLMHSIPGISCSPEGRPLEAQSNDLSPGKLCCSASACKFPAAPGSQLFLPCREMRTGLQGERHLPRDAFYPPTSPLHWRMDDAHVAIVKSLSSSGSFCGHDTCPPKGRTGVNLRMWGTEDLLLQLFNPRIHDLPRRRFLRTGLLVLLY